MRGLEAPKSKAVMSKHRKGSRARYWAINETPKQTKQKQLGVVRRFNRDDRSAFQRVYELGETSDVAVMKSKPYDLHRNLAFLNHQSRLRGAIQRLLKVNPWRPLPRRVEAVAMKTAFTTKSKGEK